ncbi:DUF1513 domain-containing protein [Vibrio sp. SS-MA-C1-2]|uniref:DUF1513 domain-containing protein n=1 Tax=Vibrio sp. SS-MA-C1-2 TaxID=2908646 RepID=UPI001F31CC70|nr:DUF1513 domain-containing protein [Vibrio sp. SS-MA-C1-2]UJF18374.1 DUF1513 domain-containing protein [Vibrio sp. SS-MA-C1-2]
MSITTTDEWVIATSPRGNCYGIWSQKSGELLELASLSDTSGICSHGNQFAISSGSGVIVIADERQSRAQRKRKVTSIVWDNHWSRIS